MKLSVIMAVGQDSGLVDMAVKSILQQSLEDFELIIVADGVKLKRLGKLDKRIKLIQQQQQGLTKSLNVALALAKAPIIARMDADDVAQPDRFKRQWNYLKRHPQIALIGSWVNLIDSYGKFLRVKPLPVSDKEIKQAILRYCPMVHPTWMGRLAAIAAVGGYNQEFIYAQDYDLLLRLARRFCLANFAEPLLNYRVNYEAATSLKHLKSQEKFALLARWRALTRYGYSWLESGKLIKPLLSFLLPVGIKKVIYRHWFWNIR